jgi:uncharacterized protein (TIGR02001 family)
MLTSIRGLVAASLVAGAGFAAAPAFAQDTAPPGDFTISGSAAVVSQYRFRGISQSDNKPAVQASITLSHKSGFYVATWGSSASAGNSTVDIGGSEIDVYGGYTHALGASGVTIDAGLYGYLYPGNSSLDYFEVYGSLSKTLGPATAKAGIYFAPEQANVGRHNTYVYGELSGGIPGTPVTLHGHIGHTGGAFDYTKDYIDYSVGASASWKRVTFDISWVDTNVSHADARRNPLPDGSGALSPYQTYRAAKGVVVGSITASF